MAAKHMANRTNTDADKNRGCGAFHLFMDEFCDSKITISVQWDHRKAMSEEDSSSPANSSRNAKILDAKRNTHSPEQQDNFTRMHNGLRTRSTDSRYHSGSRGKNKFGHSSRIYRANNCNRLNSNRRRTKGCAPVRQKRRGQAPERNKAIQEEVEKLVDADIIKEVHYHSWLSNPVMVKKHDDSRRMCVDFKDLNKACPKDGYPLPEIDWKVESLCGYPFKCFLDAYKGYHQIKMAKDDEEKTTFITSQGVFCYSKMPFGLKNAGATYQRLVDKAFQKQIGRNLEVYVDDLVIKSRTEHEIIRDMEETFKTLKEINMKLNPKKCTFGIKEGTFMGYKVNTEGIMVCPDKVGAVFNLPSPKCLKDVHKLNGKLTTEAEAAFKEMKKLIAELPTLTAPMEREELIVYLAAAREAVSAVLMTEREVKQMPVYFVSRALQGPKINYTSMEKLVLALVHASKRLKRYFQAHTIIVITDQPIKQILSRPKVAGRLQKWSIELGEYDIQYIRRTSVKGQILADFIVEHPEDDPLDTPMKAEEELLDPWTFDATNNEAEYEALIAGLRIAEQMGVKNLQASVDSCLVANQVPRSENKKADALSKIASTSFTHLTKQVLVEELKEKSINETKVLTVVEEEGDTWMTPIYNYLIEETLPAEKEKARDIRRKSGSMHAGTRYVVAKAIRTGYYWPTMHVDARKLIRAYIAGPFSEGPRKVKFIIVALDYFTKWIEAKPVATITESNSETTHSKTDAKSYASANALLPHDWMKGARIGLRNFHMFYGHRTMIKLSNGDTPFSLTYGTEAVIPAEIGMHSMRTTEVDMMQNDEALEINLDLLEERREQAAICEAKSKVKMKKYYNSKVRNTSFKPEDLVYRSNEASHAKESGKLSPKWE
ncbi:reverse transcriptase domain-containing protein [Tanacetum coccineum]